MPRVSYSRQADHDLNAIWDYIADDNRRAADALLRAIARKAELIATQPMMGQARPELEMDLRSIPEQRYTIFFRPVTDGIEIVRILHSARDVDAVFTE